MTSPSSAKSPLVTDVQLERLARLMSAETYRNFAILVNFDDDDFVEWEAESDGDVTLSALKMLKTWKVCFSRLHLGFYVTKVFGLHLVCILRAILH